jgi:hypothetical protein
MLDTSMNVLDSMIMYIQDAESPNHTLVKIYNFIKCNSNKSCHYAIMAYNILKMIPFIILTTIYD